jgi:precorrin-6B methylase 2
MWQKLKIYLREAGKFRRDYPHDHKVHELLLFFFDWARSLQTGASPLNDRRPWITFAAIRYLEKNLKKDMRVYEYGAGGSTLFFAKRVREVISVEHDPNWRNQVVETLTKAGYENCRIDLIEPARDDLTIDKDPSDPDAYMSSGVEFKGKSFRNYATSIDEYPDEYFDVVVIDGRARPSCFKHAASKVKSGGFLMLDNAEREIYAHIHKTLENSAWLKTDLSGPGPYNEYFWQTCVWTRRG